MLAAASVANAMQPPELPFAGRAWPARSKVKPSTGIIVGTFSIRFEEATLESVAKELGGRISHQGDAGESIYWLCYTGPTGRLWIVSHGEMGGEAHAVNYVVGEELTAGAAAGDCPTLPKGAESISLDNGFWIGASAGRVTAILGQPSFRKESLRSFDYEGKEPGRCEPDGFDVMNWLIMKERDGRIIRIYAGQVTSC